MKHRTQILFSIFLLFGIIVNGNASKTPADTYRLLHLFNEVFRHIRQESAVLISDRELIEGAISGMMRTVDSYSYYIPEERYKNMVVNFKGELEGIGLELVQEGEKTKIITPFEYSPAWRAGIKPGDQILSINGKKTDGLSLLEIGDLMQGTISEPIVLEIKREGSLETFCFTLKREKIVMKNIRWEMKGPVAYLRLSNFNYQHTSSHLKKALEAILKQNPKGLVLDLRNNPGGLLDEALKCTNFFIENSVIVQVQPREKEKTYRYETAKEALVPSLPMIVLVNEGTASCAEIMAGALQDHQRALIMGSSSFGKGKVQSILPLSPGYAAIQLTTAHYLTPKGRNIQSVGIQPDVLLKHSMGSQDIVKEEAINLLKARGETPKKGIS